MTPQRLTRLREALDRRQPDLTVVMDRTQKSHNIAAVMRTADAVGLYELHAVSVDGIRSHHMISGGVRKWVRVQRHQTLTDCFGALRGDGFTLLTAHRGEQSVDYREVDYTKRIALVLGSELHGVAPQTLAASAKCVSVPMEGLTESLNVSVAAALLLFEARRQREAAGLYDGPSRLPAEQYANTLFEWAYPHIARRCHERGLPYPPLREDGQMAHNPLDPPAGRVGGATSTSSEESI
ncbi:MAG: tRNA (guanosine(18)-2'-O)-methyltransferase TrmH [Pseudomonadota bacterium]